MQPIVPQTNNSDQLSSYKENQDQENQIHESSNHERSTQEYGIHHRVEPTGAVTAADLTPTPPTETAPQQAHVYTAPDAPVSNSTWQPSTPDVLAKPEPAQSKDPWEAPEHNIPASGWNVAVPAINNSLNPQAVVQVLSPRGVEYVFLTISLFTAAFGLASALISTVNGQFGYATLSFPVALLLVGLPVFAALFLRLKKAELNNPDLALDPSKRRSTQVTQVICFVICLFSLIGLVVAIFSKIGGQLHTSVGKILLDVGVLLLVFGAILFYYWRDEHQNELGQ